MTLTPVWTKQEQKQIKKGEWERRNREKVENIKESDSDDEVQRRRIHHRFDIREKYGFMAKNIILAKGIRRLGTKEDEMWDISKCGQKTLRVRRNGGRTVHHMSRPNVAKRGRNSRGRKRARYENASRDEELELENAE